MMILRDELNFIMKDRFEAAMALTEGRPFLTKSILLRLQHICQNVSSFLNMSSVEFLFNRAFNQCHV